MKRSVDYRSRVRATCGTYIDVLTIFLGCRPVPLGQATNLAQDALKVKEPIPDVVVLLAIGDHATSLAQDWKSNPKRAKLLFGRGNSTGIDYLKEIAIWKFSNGDFQKVHSENAGGPAYEIDLRALALSGLGTLIDSHEAFKIAPTGHVFKHPSGKRSKQFFLANELLRNEIDAYFVALCVCSVAWAQLKQTQRLLIDTMGIYPVARAMEELIQDQDVGEPGVRRWEIISFHSHEGVSSIHESAHSNHTVLISASTSGGMARSVASGGTADDAIITLLDVTRSGRAGQIIYAHDEYVRGKGGSSSQREDRSAEEASIELGGEYFAATGKKPRPLVLTIDHAPKGLQAVLKSFSSKENCCLDSKRQDGTSTIDAVSINEEAICTDLALRGWIKEELRLRTPISVSHVLAMHGPASEALANFCGTNLEQYRGSAPEVVTLANVTSLANQPVTGVLIVGALVGNGHAMRVASRDLRELVPDASRHFLVGVGLPETEESWTRLKQFLAQSGDPARPYAVSVWNHLPVGKLAKQSASSEIPRLLTQTEHINTTALYGWPEDLVAESVGLAGDILQDAKGGLLPSPAGNPLSLTRGFVYWRPSKEQIAAADSAAVSLMSMSAALQSAREFHDAAKRLRSSLHETVVLDPENFLRFNDGPLQASVLRAAHAFELDYSSSPEISMVMREFLEKVFLNMHSSYGSAAPEFALALATGRLQLTNEDLQTLVQGVSSIGNAPSATIGLLYMAMRKDDFS